MLSAVLGLFSQDLALDLGTSHTRIWMRNHGVVIDEPTVVAVHRNTRGRRKVLAIGKDALPMLGRTPHDVHTVKPIKDGRIADFEVAEALLVHLVRRVHGRNSLMSPRMVVAVPCSTSDVERRAVRDSCKRAGAREVHLVPRSLAAAIGANLPIEQPRGHLVVDIGGGAAEIGVLSLRGVVASKSVPGGGEAMDEAIVTMLRDRFDLLVGHGTAERLKLEIGAAMTRPPATSRVAGRCLRTGVPRAVEVSAEDVTTALAPAIDAIAAGIREVLEGTPPGLASDVAEHGVVLVGGASSLRRLDIALRDRIGLPVMVLDEGRAAAVTGIGRALESRDLLEAVSC